jgi:hypothetical protein
MLSKLKCELDEILFRMRWSGGEADRRPIEKNLMKWKQHLDDHAREPPREHAEKVVRQWNDGIRLSMPA